MPHLVQDTLVSLLAEVNLRGLVSASYSDEEIELTHSMHKQLYTLGLPSVSGQEQDHQALLVPEIGLHLARQAAGLLLRYF